MSLATNTHEFACRLVWTGAAKGGTTEYETYSRECRVDFAGKQGVAGRQYAVKDQDAQARAVPQRRGPRPGARGLRQQLLAHGH